MLTKLPAAFFSGVRLNSINENSCSVRIPFKWFNQNPFRSTYFACLSMAAEMSTGVLAMAHVYKSKPTISMLVSKIEGNFIKKATEITVFTCNEGLAIKQTIDNAIQSGQGKAITAKTIGLNSSNETIAEFSITWSFKVKSNKS